MKPFIFLVCLFISFFHITASEPDKKIGSLIVTYDTGPKAERLKRVRFWLKHENGTQAMYPRGNAFIENEINKTRTVVIDDLAAGHYTLNFIIPNRDHLFDVVNSKQFDLKPGQVKELKEKIIPRYISLVAQAELDNEGETPEISLLDSKGFTLKKKRGKLKADTLKPGLYQIKFHDLDGYETPEPQQVQLVSNFEIEPILGHYRKIKNLENLGIFEAFIANHDLEKFPTLSLIKSNGETVADSQEGHLKSYIEEGIYTLTFEPIKGYHTPRPLDIEIIPGKTEPPLSVVYLPDFAGIKAYSHFPDNGKELDSQPVMLLTDLEGRKIAKSNSGELYVEKAKPGYYILIFGAIEGYQTPEPVHIDLKIGEENHVINGMYKTIPKAEPSGSLIISYDTGGDTTYLDKIRIKLQDQLGNVAIYPEKNEKISDPLTHGYLVYIPKLNKGRYTLEFYLEDAPYALRQIPIKIVKIDEGKTNTIRQQINIDHLIADNNHDIKPPKPGIDDFKDMLENGSPDKEPLDEKKEQEDDSNPQDSFSQEMLQPQVSHSPQTKKSGNLDFSTFLPSDESLHITVKPKGHKGKTLSKTLTAKRDVVFWKSSNLPTGQYIVSINTPKNYLQIPDQIVDIKSNETIILSPQIKVAKKLTVTTDTSQAIFTLKSQFDENIWSSSGKTYTFTGLEPGKYTLEFSTLSPDLTPPKPMNIEITKDHDAHVKVNYKRL